MAAKGNDVWGGPTDWSLVAGAAEGKSGDDADRSWRELVERYRHPVKLSVRRKIHDQSLADDTTDAFFTYLFTTNVLEKADQEKGRFRCYLQGVLRLYMLHERSRAAADRSVPLPDDVAFEKRPEVEAEEEVEWATAVLQNAIAVMLKENRSRGELLLRVHGISPYPKTSTAALSAELDMKPNAIFQANFRSKKRLRELILSEIRSTVLSERDYALESDVIVRRLMETYSQVFADADEE